MMQQRGAFGDLIEEYKDLIGNRGSISDINRISNRMREAPFGRFKKYPSKIQSEMDDVAELVSSRNLPVANRRVSQNFSPPRNAIGRNKSRSSNLFNSRKSDLGGESPRRWKPNRVEDRDDIIERRRTANKDQKRVNLSPHVQRSNQKAPVNPYRSSLDPTNSKIHNSNPYKFQQRSRSPIILPNLQPNNTTPNRNKYKKPEILRVITPEKNRGKLLGPTFASTNRLVPPSDEGPIFNSLHSNTNNPPRTGFVDPPAFNSQISNPHPVEQSKPPFVEKVALRQINPNETKDTEIRDKQTYFKNYATEKVDIPELTANKFDINSSGSNLYLTGLMGTTAMSVDIPSIQSSKANLKVYQGNRPDKRSFTLYRQQENFITQEPNTNDLVLNDKNMNELSRLHGKYEPGKVIEHFHEYRDSTDDDYMLWRKGEDDIAVVDKVLFKERYSVPGFWIHQGSSCMPVACCGDRTGGKIMASSMAGPSTHILHYYDEMYPNEFPISRITEEAVSGLKRVTAMDISADGKVVYLAGLGTDINKFPKMVAVTMDKNFGKICEYPLSDLKYGKIRRVKRIRGYEILVVAGKGHIAVLEYANNRFTKIGTLAGIHKNEITDLAIKDHIIFSKGYDEQCLKMTYLGPRAGRSKSNSPTAQSYESVFSSGRDEVDSSGHSPRGYEEVKRDKIETDLSDIEKVSVSKSGNNLYLGGSTGLNIYSRKSGTTTYTPYKLDSSKSNFPC